MGWQTLDVFTFQLLTSLVLGAVSVFREPRVLSDSQIIQARWETEAFASRWSSQTRQFALQPGLKETLHHMKSRGRRDPFLRSHVEVSGNFRPSAAKNNICQRFIWTPHPMRSSSAKSVITFCWGDDQLGRNCTSVTASRSQNAERVHLHAKRECDAFKKWERSRAAGRGGRLRLHFHWSLSCWDLWRPVGVQRVVKVVIIMWHFLKTFELEMMPSPVC